MSIVPRFVSSRMSGLLFLAACANAWGSPPVPVALPVTEVADGIYVHRGAHADVDDPGRGDSANIGFIVGQQCVAVVDTGGSLATGRALDATIAQTTARPVCYVINTHVHFDHVLGNAAFRRNGVEFIGHENLDPAMAANREFFAETFAQELDGGRADLVVAPTTTVGTKRVLDLGGREIELEAHPTAHTNADLTVFDRATGTLWTGDLLFMERLPIIDGSLRGWIKWIEAAGARPYVRVVPGHGPASAAWPDAIDAEKAYLNALLTDARAAIASGEFLEDAMETMSREAAAPWVLNARHPRNVSRAYRELEWE